MKTGCAVRTLFTQAKKQQEGSDLASPFLLLLDFMLDRSAYLSGNHVSMLRSPGCDFSQ